MQKAPHVLIWIALAAIGLTGMVTGCGEINPARPSGSAALGPAGADHAAPASEAAYPVGPELAEVRRATARFHDLSVAMAAGYSIENEPCVASPAGGMGIHAPNLTLLFDPAVEPARPELLLYEPKANGGYRLVGVEYFQAVLLLDLQQPSEEEPEPAPWFESTPWDPVRYQVVNPPPQLFGQTFHLSPPPAPGVPWHYALHVWVWRQNPSGMFADWNPRVRCP